MSYCQLLLLNNGRISNEEQSLKKLVRVSMKGNTNIHFLCLWERVSIMVCGKERIVIFKEDIQAIVYCSILEFSFRSVLFPQFIPSSSLDFRTINRE